MEASEYKCPNCGADLKFDPAQQKLSCEYCDSTFTIEEVIFSWLRKSLWQISAQVLSQIQETVTLFSASTNYITQNRITAKPSTTSSRLSL